MDEQMSKPRRLAESTESGLVTDAQRMRAIVEHRREQMETSAKSAVSEESASGKTLVASVHVQLWVDDDGTESLTVMGDVGANTLELKGLLHDGLYALVHHGEQGYLPGM